MKVIQRIRMDLCGCAIPPIINAMQNDGNTRIVEVSLYSRGAAWLPPEGVTVSVHYQKPDGTAGMYDTLPDGTLAYTITDNVVAATLAPQMTTVPGKIVASLVFLDGLGKQLATFPFYVQVAADPAAEAAESENYYRVTTWDEVNAYFADILTRLSAVEAGGGGGGTGGGGSTVELDTTMTKSGKAADAKAVGDKLSNLQTALSNVETAHSTRMSTIEDTLVDVEESLGDIESALDSIIALQNSLIGGES